MKLKVDGVETRVADLIETSITGATVPQTVRRIAIAFERILLIMWIRGEINAAFLYEIVTGEEPGAHSVEMTELPTSRRPTTLS